ncbi:hypothetical protein PAECIP111893_02361 [Paenibacillus plantiphilus]|uniref:Uncharacterized protein n=1 Tax=Paenibacillus plantiphilus TaxID=2905650 RepID=A0ABM9C6G4_9BACL|nr:hypothetical protein PAECIP111893_02361 [Paenibacillus plantiphilus]
MILYMLKQAKVYIRVFTFTGIRDVRGDNKVHRSTAGKKSIPAGSSEKP